MRVISSLILLLFLFFPTSAHAVLGDCNTSTVQTAVNAAATGDIIVCPAGSYTWSGLSVSKAITLQGAAGNSTAITLTASNTFTKSASGLMKITGFTINSSTGSATNQWLQIAGSWKAARPIIWTNNIITVNGGLFNISVTGGVIWSGNTITTVGSADSIFHIKNPSDSDGSWTNVDTMGTNDTASRLSGTVGGTSGELNLYIEDNTITGGTTQGLDCDDACRIVFRNNATTNFRFNSHGLGTSAVGARHWELYSNDMRSSCSSGTDCGALSNLQQFITMRGGTGVIYNNTTDNLRNSTWGDKKEVLFGQDSNHDSAAVNCQPVPGPYPLSHQLGWGYNGTSQFLDPIYLWNNSVRSNGSSPFLFDLTVGWFYTCPLDINNYVQSGREYFNNSGSTTPTKPGYTAFTYPHPLLGGGGPDTTPPSTPTGFTVR